MGSDDTLIRVHQQWSGYWTADVRLRDLEDIHWFQPRGAPRPLLHGYIVCANIVSGDMPHDCAAGAGSHRLLVCVLKKHNTSVSYGELTRRAEVQRPLRDNPLSNRVEHDLRGIVEI